MSISEIDPWSETVDRIVDQFIGKLTPRIARLKATFLSADLRKELDAAGEKLYEDSYERGYDDGHDAGCEETVARFAAAKAQRAAAG
jgi:hypothetical protein